MFGVTGEIESLVTHVSHFRTRRASWKNWPGRAPWLYPILRIARCRGRTSYLKGTCTGGTYGEGTCWNEVYHKFRLCVYSTWVHKNKISERRSMCIEGKIWKASWIFYSNVPKKIILVFIYLIYTSTLFNTSLNAWNTMISVIFGFILQFALKCVLMFVSFRFGRWGKCFFIIY